MSPTDISKYESIYTANKTPHGLLNYSSLDPLYSSLDVPDTDIRSAWNLVNPNAEPAISKHAALAFLHILNGRHEGYRVPRSVPPSLRASFEEQKINHAIDRADNRAPAQRWAHDEDDRETSTGRKAKFGDTYLSRLGVGGKSSYTPPGTDFSSTRTPSEWEEVRLKKQLSELESKISTIESSSKSPKSGRQKRREDSSKPALVKRELEMLLEYKRIEMRELERGEGRSAEAGKLGGVREEIEGVSELVGGLEAHLRTREGVLEGLKRDVEEAKR